MKIAIDARPLSHPQKGGFKTYTSSLVQNLVTLDRTVDYLLYLDRPIDTDLGLTADHISLKSLARWGGKLSVPLREQLLLPLDLRSQHCDLVYYPTGSGFPWPGIPSVATIHDAIEFLYEGKAKDLRHGLMSLYNRSVLRVVGRRAQAIITVSEYSKQDLVQILGVPVERVFVVPIAAPEYCRLVSETVVEDVRQQYNLPRKFLLALASASPRKNAMGLLRIYARLPADLRAQYPLLIVWTHPALAEQVSSQVHSLGISAQVRFLHAVSDDTLVALYNAATIFVFPSLYEGFGLPILEAMACGAAVISSNLTSMPEVAGDAAALVDPTDEAAFAATLCQLLENESYRHALVEAGHRRATLFTWQRTAEMTLEIFKAAIQQYSSHKA